MSLQSTGTPHNLECEEIIIGSILMKPKLLYDLQDLLSPNHFYSSRFAQLYGTMIEAKDSEQELDSTLLATLLREKELLKPGEEKSFLLEMEGLSFGVSNIRKYAEIVVEKWTRRELISAANEIIFAANDTSKDIGSVQSDAENKIMSTSSLSDVKKPKSYGEELDSFMANYGTGQDNKNHSTGHSNLDALIGGWGEGDLVIVAGRPSIGKTAVLVDFCLQSLLQDEVQGISTGIIFFSMEMSAKQIIQRFQANIIGVNSQLLMQAPTDPDRLAAILSKLWSQYDRVRPFRDCFHIDETPGEQVTLPYIRREVLRLSHFYKRNGGKLKLVILDYLQLMGGSNEVNRVNEISRITRGLKSLSREAECTFMVASQLSRAVESRNSKRPLMSDLRDSGGIEQEADIIGMLYRDEYYNPDTPDQGILEINISKNRNGPVGLCQFEFDKPTGRIRAANKPRPVPNSTSSASTGFEEVLEF